MKVEGQENKERVEVHVSVACIIVNSWEEPISLLMVRQKDSGKWGVPAGKLEFVESPLQAAMREFEEETGESREAITLRKAGQEKVIVLRDGRVSIGLWFVGEWSLMRNNRLYLSGDVFVPESEETDLVKLMRFEDVVEMCANPQAMIHRPEYSLPVFYYWLHHHLNCCDEGEFYRKIDWCEERGLDMDMLVNIAEEGYVRDLREGDLAV